MHDCESDVVTAREEIALDDLLAVNRTLVEFTDELLAPMKITSANSNASSSLHSSPSLKRAARVARLTWARRAVDVRLEQSRSDAPGAPRLPPAVPHFSNRLITTYRTDMRKGDLQQTGVADASADLDASHVTRPRFCIPCVH